MSLYIETISKAIDGDVIRDEVVRGLHVRVRNGRKTFFLYYRTKAGEERRPKIGDFPTITINDARRIARRLLNDVADGKDPSAENKAARAAMTVNELVDTYEKRILPQRRSARSIKVILGHIRKHLGSKKVVALDLPDVEALHARLSRTSPIQANRVVASLSALLTLAEKLRVRGLNTNFCKLVDRNPEVKRRRYLKPGDEAKAVGAALRKRLYTSEHEGALFILLLLLTGARKGEIGGAKEVQREGDTIILDQHKTSATAGTKTIFLPPAAVSLLDDPLRPQHVRRGFLVGVADPRKLWKAIRKEAGCPDLRLHDLRHSFVSFGLGAGLGLSTLGPLVGHASTQTTNGYAHLIEDPARQAVKKIGDTVTGALGLD